MLFHLFHLWCHWHHHRTTHTHSCPQPCLTGHLQCYARVICGTIKPIPIG